MLNVIPFVHGGLGNSSYLLQVGEGEAALIDPDRCVDRYLEAAGSHGWTIGSIFETHGHADFVSGALEAAHVTGAPIYLPGESQAEFSHSVLSLGLRTPIGGVTVEPIASPGHTPEHTSYVFRGDGATPVLFSGGSLIVGGASRTDLISEQMTGPLTRALHGTLMTAFSSLADETMLCPTHGAGSF